MHLHSPYVHVLWLVDSVVGVLVTILGVQILMNFRRANLDFLRARMFLGDTLYVMWLYSTLFGVFAILYWTLLTLYDAFHLDIRTLVEVSRSLFVISFLGVTYRWHILIKRSVEA